MTTWSQPQFADPPRDEVADQRERHAQTARTSQVPHQRAPHELSEPDREDYELQMDAYEVQLQAYRHQLADYAERLDAAHHDALTGAWLRAAGHLLLEQEVERAARTGEQLSLAFVDVDGLKKRNDTRGHAAGDHALRTIARALLGGLRGYDHVVRWGGDEFLCVLPGADDRETTARLEQAARELAADPEELSISIGIAQWSRAETADALVARADAVLYDSRHRTRSS